MLLDSAHLHIVFHFILSTTLSSVYLGWAPPFLGAARVMGSYQGNRMSNSENSPRRTNSIPRSLPDGKATKWKRGDSQRATLVLFTQVTAMPEGETPGIRHVQDRTPMGCRLRTDL